jgi:hypothetical protein
MLPNSITSQINASGILRVFDQSIADWHKEPSSSSDLWPHELRSLLDLHRANYDLWHEEDKARDPNATDAAIAQVKRNIDRFNQQRVDSLEQFDAMLFQLLAEYGLPNPAAPLHSETPGMMVDRLSILSLKLYHTQVEIDRANATVEHKDRNRERLEILNQQRADLADCLNALWQQVLDGQRRFKLYRQLKMYNDPTLNPVIRKAVEGQ